MTWYILPNGNIRNINGLELQPEQDWFPTPDSLDSFVEEQRNLGKSEAQVIMHMMDLAIECEEWAQKNLT